MSRGLVTVSMMEGEHVKRSIEIKQRELLQEKSVSKCSKPCQCFLKTPAFHLDHVC